MSTPSGCYGNALQKPSGTVLSMARSSGNGLGKSIRDVALGINVQANKPMCNTVDGLKRCEGMLHMLTDIYGKIALIADDTHMDFTKHTGVWTTGFLNGVRYQLQRMLTVLLETLKSEQLPKRFRVCRRDTWICTH